MKKVVRIFILLSVVAMSCVLICCSGGGSSSDDDDAPAVSTTSTPTNYLARLLYTTREGENMVDSSMCVDGYLLYNNRYAIPDYNQTYIRVDTVSSDTTTTPPTVTFSLTAIQGYHILLLNNRYEACPLPAGIIGNEIDPVTNCWVR